MNTMTEPPFWNKERWLRALSELPVDQAFIYTGTSKDGSVRSLLSYYGPPLGKKFRLHVNKETGERSVWRTL